MIFNLRRSLLRSIIKLYSKAWSVIIVLINCSWQYGSFFIAINKKYNATILAIKNESIISNPDVKESVKAGTSLFYITHKRLDNINWGSL